MSIQDGFKDSEVGRIPGDWCVSTLGDLMQITSSKRVFQKDWRSSGVPFYRARELAVMSEHGQVDNELFIDPEMYDNYARKYGAPREGDLLVTGVGTLGKTYVVRAGERFYFKDGNIIWLKRSKVLDPRFLEQLYGTPVVKTQVFGESAGTTVGTYTITSAKSTKIPLPTLAEQQQIAEALCDADALIQSLQCLIAKKRAIKQGIARDLLTGMTRLPEFSGEWRSIALGEVASLSKGSGLPKKDLSASGLRECVHYGELFTHYGVEIREVHSRTDRDSLPVLSLANDVLMPTSDVTPRGLAKASSICRAGVILGGDILVIRPDGRYLDGRFLARTIRFDKRQIMELVSGTTVFHIYASDMRNFRLPLPPLDEQRAIAAALADIDVELDALSDRLTKSRDIQRGMTQELLTGRTRLVPQRVAA